MNKWGPCGILLFKNARVKSSSYNIPEYIWNRLSGQRFSRLNKDYIPDPVNPGDLSTLNSNKDLRPGELQLNSSLLFQLRQKKNKTL